LRTGNLILDPGVNPAGDFRLYDFLLGVAQTEVTSFVTLGSTFNKYVISCSSDFKSNNIVRYILRLFFGSLRGLFAVQSVHDAEHRYFFHSYHLSKTGATLYGTRATHQRSVFIGKSRGISIPGILGGKI
jgi:hypothetical protein